MSQECVETGSLAPVNSPRVRSYSQSSSIDRDKAKAHIMERQRTHSQQRSGPGDPLAHRVVLLAVDASDNAKIAFDWFLENVYRYGDLIVLTHIPEPPKLPSFSFKSGFTLPVSDWQKLLTEMNASTRKLEKEYEALCAERRLKFKVCGESSKNPGETIVKIAEKENADLICMGTRGLSGVKRTLMGSVSEEVVRTSSVPVVVVPGKKLVQLRARRSSGSFSYASVGPGSRAMSDLTPHDEHEHEHDHHHPVHQDRSPSLPADKYALLH